MSRAIIVTISTLALAACAVAPEAAEDACGTTRASTTHGLAIEARLVRASWDEQSGEIVVHEEMVDCATFTVTRPDSEWQLSGATPSSVDLAPGLYEVEIDWVEGECGYASEPVEVELGDGVQPVVVPLCADMTGVWECGEGGETWFAEAEMGDGCTLSLEGFTEAAPVRGNLVEGADATGVLLEDGRHLRGFRGEEELSCWRVE